ncbi:uncharacterized protein LOC136073959 [Hydra vulgaris]|uniref:Uncharacterized protein LOC136073959 n=1 Tax=Hydra vulgaris TaxID=6087 RepID=A0ABM4B0M5_HYDVU
MPGFESRIEAVCVIDSPSFSIDIVQKCLNNLDKRKSTGYDGLHPRVLSKCSATFAKPLSLIYKCSFANGVIPDLWKKSNVTPFFKKESRLYASNYRPVMLTSIPCKIIDSILQKRIMEHCVVNGLISPNQHGFVHRKGCISYLLETRDIMTEATHCRHAVDVIYTDLAKAFDKIPPVIPSGKYFINVTKWTQVPQPENICSPITMIISEQRKELIDEEWANLINIAVNPYRK